MHYECHAQKHVFERVLYLIKNLTEGKPSKILWQFTTPMLISIIFQQMYTIADSIIAGKFVGDTPIEGENALAAIGASYFVTMLFIQVANGINAGCAVVISQLFGGKEYVKLKTAISTSIISALLLALILTGLGFIFCNPILNVLGTPPEIFADASAYLYIFIGGLIFLFLYNVCNGIFTALGDSKTPLIFLIASSVLNVVLDLIFVIPLRMGVAGCAWATLIAQGISAILSVITLLTRIKKIEVRHKGPVFSTSMLKTISSISIPTILQQSFVSVGNLLIQGLVNDMGPSVIAGFSSAFKLNMFAVSVVSCAANGVSSFTAQNIGAGKYEHVPKAFKAGVIMSAITLMPFVLTYFFFPDFMIGLFVTEPSADILMAGGSFIKVCAPFYFILSIKLLSDGVLRGAGAMRTFMIATFSDLFIRVILCYILAPRIGFTGFCIAWPIGWVAAAIISLVFYTRGMWKDTAFSKRMGR